MLLNWQITYSSHPRISSQEFKKDEYVGLHSNFNILNTLAVRKDFL